MSLRAKKLINPIICAGLGLLVLLALLFNVVGVRTQYEEGESFSGYEMMNFGDESLSAGLNEMAEMMDKGSGGGLMVFGGVLFIVSLVLSILMLLWGGIGLVRELARKDILPFLKTELQELITFIAILSGAGVQMLATTVVLIGCLSNCYKIQFFGSSINMQVLPGVGWFLLLIFAVGAFVTCLVIRKRPAKEPVSRTPMVCASCGAAANPGDAFCAQCGGRTVPGVQTSVCSACGAVANSGDAFCAQCGGRVVTTVRAASTCPACGTPAKVGDMFCANCGAPVAAAAPASEKPVEPMNWVALWHTVKNAVVNLWKKTQAAMAAKKIPPILLPIGLIALAVIIVAVIVLVSIPWPRPDVYVKAETDYSVFFDKEDDEYVVMAGGELTGLKSDVAFSQTGASIDGDVAAFLETDDERTLWILKDGESHKVASDVLGFILSSDGTGILYHDAENQLYLYNVDEENRLKLTDELYRQMYTLSPDGDTAMYAVQKTDGDGMEETYTTYVWTDGEKEKIGDECLPVGVSNQGKLAYFLDVSKNAFRVKVGEEKSNLAGDVSTYSFMARFNADHTQVLFRYDDATYISDNGGERVKLCVGTASLGMSAMGLGIQMNSSFPAYAVRAKDFEGLYIKDGNNDLRYIDRDFETVRIASVDSFFVSDDGSVVYYEKNSSIYRGAVGDEKFAKVASNVEDYRITSDGSRCYYVTYDDTLYTVKGEGKPKKIADDVHTMAVTHDDYLVFIADYSQYSGGVLCSSRNGGEKEKIMEDVYGLIVTADATYCKVNLDRDNDVYELYTAASGDDFEKILDEVGAS